MDIDEASNVCQTVLDEIGEVVIADRDLFEQVLVAMLARGHILLEDVPGTGKTLTARMFAELLGLDFKRVQFTPDLLPTDVTGTNIYREGEQTFRFNQGPIFANIVLADEINRAPPKTQSALLEAMEERQVSVEGTTHDLPSPFFVFATQNPVEQEGTFQLPEAQVDRFMIKTSIGYPDQGGAMEMLDQRGERTSRIPEISARIGEDLVEDLRDVPETVYVDESIKRYIIDIGERTRAASEVEVGVSPRGIQRLYEASRARAVIEGRDYVVPEDVKRLIGPVFAHRLVLTTETRVRGTDKREVIDRITDTIEVPPEDEARPP